MQPAAVRVVYLNQPYLVIRHEDGSIDRAFGPFTPGTEPSLEECSADHEVRDRAVLASLRNLLPVSPELLPSQDTLAGTD